MSATSVCCGCLNTDRKMSGIEEFWKKHYFSQIISEVTMSHPLTEPLQLCYECDALLTKFIKFGSQVKHSFRALCDYSQKNITILNPNPSALTINYNVYEITVLPDMDTEEDISQVVLEEDTSIYSDDQDTEYLGDHDDEPKKKRKPRKKKKRSNEMYTEVKLRLAELREERKQLSLREEYVNAMFKCESCVLAFPSGADLADHESLKHSPHTAYKCKICARTFRSEASQRYHARWHVRRYACNACSRMFASERAAAAHYRHAHCEGPDIPNGISTVENNEEADDSPEIPNGISTVEKNGEADDSMKQAAFPCEFCHKSFRWKTSLRKHLEAHKIETGQKRKPYCEPCRLTFTTTSNLQKHVKTSSKHQIQLKLRKLQEKPVTDPSSDTRTAEQIRTAISRAMQQYQCLQCDKKFQWRGNLARHLLSHDARAKGELVCEPCNRTFSSIATYKQHMKISRKHVSENEFKYMCSDCGKRFANKTRLKDHIDWEHLKNYTHTCGLCQKVFKSHTSLYIHRQVVHMKDGTDHLCDTCGKAFPNFPKLRSHMSAHHSGAAPYPCPNCPARFRWHSCLYRHIRRAHPGNARGGKGKVVDE